MNIKEIKEQIGLKELVFKPVVSEENGETKWYKAWDNDSRTMIVINTNLLVRVSNDKSINTLNVKKEVRDAKGGEYTYCLITETITV